MSPSAQLRDQTILVTGARGFLGSALCQCLHRNGLEFHAVSRTRCSHDQQGAHWWNADLTDYKAVHHLFTAVKPDLVIHLAGRAHAARELSEVMPTFACNLATQVNLLTAASNIGCHRIILPGSLEEPQPGETQDTASSPYAASKWAASIYARTFHALYQLPVVNLCIFMAYGPRQQAIGKLVPHVILSLLRGEAPKLSSGLRQVDWIYVEDVVDGILAAAVASDLEGATIDLGSGSLIPIRTLVQYLVDLVNPRIEPIFGALPDRPMEQVRAANVEKTYAKIGYMPKTSLEDGLRFTVDWYSRQFRTGAIKGCNLAERD